MNFLAFTGLACCITAIFLGLFAYIKSQKNILHKTYLAYFLSIFIYGLFYFLWQKTDNIIAATFYFRWLVFGIIAINLFYLLFVLIFTGLLRQKKVFFLLNILLSFYFLYLNFAGALYQPLLPKYNLGFWPSANNFTTIYIVFWHFQALYGVFCLFEASKLSDDLRRQQIKYFTIAAIIGYIGGSSNWPMWYGVIPLLPSLNILIAFCIGIVAYVIVRHKLMDIEVFIKKTLIFSVLLFFAFAVCSFLAVVFQESFLSALGKSTPIGRLNFFGAANVFTAISCISMGIFLFLRSAQNHANKIFALVCFFVTIWAVGAAKLSMAMNKELAFFWWQIAHIGAIGAPVLYFHFLCVFLKIDRKWILRSAYFLGTVFVVLTFFARDVFIGDLRFAFNQFYVVDWFKYHNFLYLAFFISFYFILVGYCFCLLINAFRHSVGNRHIQLGYFILASIVAWIGPENVFLAHFGIDVYPYLIVMIGIYPLIIGYAIVRHQLMDVEVFIKKTLIFTGLLLVVYFLLSSVVAIGPSLLKITAVHAPLSQTHLNIFAISGFLLGFTCLFLGCLVLRFTTNSIQLTFALQNIAIAIWGFGCGFAGNSLDVTSALFWWKVAHIGGYLLIVFLLHHLLLVNKLSQKWLLVALYAVAISILIFLFSGFPIMNLRYAFNSFYFPKSANLIYPVSVIEWIGIACYGTYLIVRAYQKNIGEKKSFKLYAIAYIIGLWGGAAYFMPVFGIEIYPYGNFLIPIYCLIMTYAIFRHKLFDIEVFIRKTLIFAGLFGFLYLMFALFVSAGQVPVEGLIGKLTIPWAGEGFAAGFTWTISNLIVFITCILLIFVLIRFGTAPAHRILLFFNLSVCVWGCGAILIGLAQNGSQAMLFWKVAVLGAIFSPTLSYHFITVLGKLKRSKTILLFYAFSLLYYVLFVFEKLGVKIEFLFNSIFYIRPTDWRLVAICVIWVGIILFTLTELFRLYVRSNGNERTQYRYIFIGFLIGFAGAIFDAFPVMGISVFPFANIGMSIYPALLTYAILRHRLLGIEVIVKRTLIFAGLFGVVYAVFVLFAILGQVFFERLVTQNRWISMIPSIIAITFIARPLENFLVNITDKYLFQKRYDYRDLVKAFSRDVLTIMDMERLSSVTVEKLADIIKLESCAFLSCAAGETSFRIVAAHGLSGGVGATDPLIVTLKSGTPYISLSRKDAAGDKPSAFRDQLKAELLIPLSPHGVLSGIIALGKKKSDEEYTREDIDILVQLGGALSIALSNAHLVDEIGRTRATAAQKEKMAAIGTLAAGMAHEIRNPLTTIRTFADYLPERQGDTRFLSTFGALLPNEIERIETIVRSLLEFSHTDAVPHREDVGLAQVVATILAILEPLRKSVGARIDFTAASGLMARADRGQVQDAFFNIIKYVISEMSRGETIKIMIKRADGAATLIVKGIGLAIPDYVMKDVFEPVSEVHRARRGFGFHLFIAKELLEKNGGVFAIDVSADGGAEISCRFS